MGDARSRQLAVDELAARFAQGQSQPQQMQVNLKILGQDFTVMAMFDMALHFLGGSLQVLEGVKKEEAAKAFKSAFDHLNKSKQELFAKAVAEAEKQAPKVEVVPAGALPTPGWLEKP